MRNGLYRTGRRRRRWRDGPRWAWLCRVFDHQRECWHWYSWCGLSPSWHHHGTTGSGVDWYCERCGEGQSFQQRSEKAERALKRLAKTKPQAEHS